MILRVIRFYVAVLACLLAFAAGLVGWDSWRFLHGPLPVSERRLFKVEQGSSLHSVSRRLVTDHLVLWPHHAFYFRSYGRLQQMQGRIKAGEYEILPGMTPIVLLQNMVQGRTYQHAITLIEGWNFSQMMKAIRSDASFGHSLVDTSKEGVMKALGHPGEHPEGRFFPDTYLFPSDSTDLDVLRRAYQAMSKILEEEWATRAEGLPLSSPYEALVLASIVQRETALPAERFEIAGVFTRRLQHGMRLQTDPTVIYGLGENFDGDIRFADLKRDTPYNTYTRDGLPPTPICMPGQDAIHAALHPAEGNSLYFVSRGDGSHQFSATLEEHNAAVKQYQSRRRPLTGPGTPAGQDATQPGPAATP
jgi:UPF0755 protein